MFRYTVRLHQHHRGCNLSDFHEMATHLRMQEERSLLIESHGYLIGADRNRSGAGKQRFSYSDHLKRNKVGQELKIVPKRKFDKKSDG